MSLDDYVRYLEKLEIKHRLDKTMRNRKRSNDDSKESIKEKSSGKGKRNRNDKSRGGNNASRKPSSKSEPCAHCGKPGHLDTDCWSLESNADKRPQKRQNTGRTQTMYLQEQVENLFAAAREISKEKKKKKKRKVEINDFFSMNKTNDNSSSNSSTDYINYCSNTFSTTERSFSIKENNCNTKKSKIEQLTTEVVGEIKNTQGKVWTV
jgi:hypothetical protein